MHDREFVLSLRPAVDAVHAAGTRIFMQLGHGALQCMEAWHAEYRAAHPDVVALAVSEPPLWFKGLLAANFLQIPNLKVATTEELHELARAFGRAAGHAREAGYDGIHLAGANASIFQELWSPVFNKRRDEFGGATVCERSEFLRRVVREIRGATRADFPIATKVPAETAAPFFVRGALTVRDGVAIARACRDAGVDAVAPVQVGVTRDQSMARGKFPRVAWDDPRFERGYGAAFGGAIQARRIRAANEAAALALPFKPVWNEEFFREVKLHVDGVVVLAEGGIRSRAQMDRFLASGVCDMVGMARLFYAEPFAARRILRERDAHVLCESCNNCTVPQVTGLPGACRTPEVLVKRGKLEKQGAYEAR